MPDEYLKTSNYCYYYAMDLGVRIDGYPGDEKEQRGQRL
jgi:hypothetical protein